MTRRLLLVRAGGATYGVDADAVREITGPLPATRLPGAGPEVLGLVNLRGRLFPVLDLAHRLRGVPSEAQHPEVVVLSVEGKTLGLLVEDVREVITVEDGMGATPLLAGSGPGGLIREVGHFGEAVVLEVDVRELAAQSLA